MRIQCAVRIILQIIFHKIEITQIPKPACHAVTFIVQHVAVKKIPRFYQTSCCVRSNFEQFGVIDIGIIPPNFVRSVRCDLVSYFGNLFFRIVYFAFYFGVYVSAVPKKLPDLILRNRGQLRIIYHRFVAYSFPEAVPPFGGIRP